jgi:two-component system, NtrC family, sensor histidine kinase KinB
MNVTLRRRILLTVAPLVLLIVAIGISGIGLLTNLGQRSEEILRENYVSLRAMADLNRHLADAERAISIGSKPDFDEAVSRARESVRIELENITIDGEGPAADELNAGVERVATLGSRLFAMNVDVENRETIRKQLQALFLEAHASIVRIREMNERAMYAADAASQATARRSARLLAMAVGVSFVIAAMAVWWLQRTILEPIRAVTDAASAIGGGELQQMVPVHTNDEIGRLATSFNAMAARLRAYRQLDRDQLTRARQAAQATIDSFPDPVVVYDPAGRVEFANPAATRILGIHGNHPGGPMHPALDRMLETARRERRPVLTETFDDVVTFQYDGDDRAYQPQIRPIFDNVGETLGHAVVLNDVTRYRLLDRLKSDWVATVSHELKTPLTSVQLAVHVLLEEVVGPLTAKQIELLLEARDNADRLFRLIQQLLALAKVEDPQEIFDKVPVDVAGLLQAARTQIESRADDRQIRLALEVEPELPRVRVDPTRMAQVLNNLLDNAIAYTEPGGTVIVRAALQNGHVILTVADTGIGIPSEDLPHVFERFFRSSARASGREDVPGTGLGLAIVREIVEAHDGSIRCESAVGQGTTMTISLPVSEPRPEEAR